MSVRVDVGTLGGVEPSSRVLMPVKGDVGELVNGSMPDVGRGGVNGSTLGAGVDVGELVAELGSVHVERAVGLNIWPAITEPIRSHGHRFGFGNGCGTRARDGRGVELELELGRGVGVGVGTGAGAVTITGGSSIAGAGRGIGKSGAGRGIECVMSPKPRSAAPRGSGGIGPRESSS